MEDTPLPSRPRRSTMPGTSASGRDRLEARVAVLERTEQHQAETIDEIKRGQAKLAGTVDTLDTTINTLVGKVDQLLEKRKFWQKVQTGVLVGLCLLLFGFIAKISYIVQSARIP